MLICGCVYKRNGRGEGKDNENVLKTISNRITRECSYLFISKEAVSAVPHQRGGRLKEGEIW